jgi:hypothetical protein
MASTIDDLREIARQCQEGKALDTDLAHWLGVSLERFLRRQCQSIEQALGLKGERGGMPWWLEEAVRQRDTILRDMARELFPTLSPAGQARHIHRLAVRYGASAWLRDQHSEVLPATCRGKPTEWLWRAFRPGAPMPIGERQLRNILSARLR